MDDTGAGGRGLTLDAELPFSTPRSILIVMLSAVGDAVMVLPVATALRRAFPHVYLSWVLQDGPRSLVAGHPSVDEIIPFRRPRGGFRPSTARTMVGEMRDTDRLIRDSASRVPGGRYDLLLGLQVYLKAGLLTALAPARVKLGFDRKRTRDLNWLFTTHRIPPHPEGFRHVQDQYFEFLQYLEVDPKPLNYGLTLTEAERKRQEAFFRELREPSCALVVASSDHRKDWTSEGYAYVATRLYQDHGIRSLLVGGRSDAEERMAAAILRRTKGEVLDERGGGLRRLLWLLEGSRVVISPDTGPLHMARAVGTPVVGLFGFTNPKRSGPYGRFNDLVVDGYARFPGEDYPLGMERRPGGMGRVSPETVVVRAEEALRPAPDSPPGEPGSGLRPGEPPGTAPPRR